MNHLEQSFSVQFDYNIYFTSALFDLSNTTLNDFLKSHRTEGAIQKLAFIIDSGVLKCHPVLKDQIRAYFTTYDPVSLVPELLIIPGGETAKNDPAQFERIVEIINKYQIDRHSYIAAIGGGSVLDLAGYAAAVTHRGVRHIRIPTTVLSQNDSGVGVKNGINYEGKKNFLGTFMPPVAVFNDDSFLRTLDDRNWRSGISEAVKVALIRDADFFYWIEKNADALVSRNAEIMNQLIHRCAELHLQHIASGDPFEKGSSRPLDFGHWSAHKLEQLTHFEVLHGEAVAMGIALDVVYSSLSGRLEKEKAYRIIQLLKKLGFETTHPLLRPEDENAPIISGLQEFREHLGGWLTVMLLADIGKGEEVHELEFKLIKEAGLQLLKMNETKDAPMVLKNI